MADFEKGITYENVFFIFIDASGHSNIVKQNPKDKASRGFDALYKKISDRLIELTADFRCQNSVVWSWLGDGGLIAIYDEDESISINLAITFAKALLKPTLGHLQDEFSSILRIRGELHLRIAIHKGTIKYTDEGQQGFIHSADINFGAHLEKVTPKDCLLISKEVYSVISTDERPTFIEVGEYEEHTIYAYSPQLNEQQLKRKWLSSRGFSGVDFIQTYSQRLSEQDKAQLIRNAQKKVIDFGTTLNTCSNYLFSTARPRPYKDAVHDLISRGGQFHCYMLEPNSTGSLLLSQLRGEDTNQKLHTSIDRFRQYVEQQKITDDSFAVFSHIHNPNFAAMVIDPDSDEGLCLYSPYFSDTKEFSKKSSERADMPHYLFSFENPLYKTILEEIRVYMDISKRINFET